MNVSSSSPSSPARNAADLLCTRADWCTPEDRALLLAVYRDHTTAADLARLTGRSLRVIRARLRRETERLLSPRFDFVLTHRQQWDARRRRVAEACILRGLTMRAASRELAVSLYSVRRHIDALNALFAQEASRK